MREPVLDLFLYFSKLNVKLLLCCIVIYNFPDTMPSFFEKKESFLKQMAPNLI